MKRKKINDPLLQNVSTGPIAIHTDDIQDIISSPPAWLIRWGIALLFGILILIFSLSAFIRYPDVITAQLKITSVNAPKPIITKVSGKLSKILVKENQNVALGQPLAYIESTADHAQILNMESDMMQLRRRLLESGDLSFKDINTPQNLQLGELQGAYQVFSQSYLSYKASVADGVYLRTKSFLKKDLDDINKQKQYLLSRKSVQEKEYELAAQEYEMHKKLTDQKVEAKMELKREESKLLSSQYPLQQTQSEILSNSSAYSLKQKDIMELDNQINEEKSKFLQSLNSLISEIAIWKNKYVLTASEPGKIVFAGFIQENQIMKAEQQVFYISQGNNTFLGDVSIPQYNMGKVRIGQKVLIKLQSYPYEEYGILTGRIYNVSEVPYQDSMFSSQIKIENSTSAKNISLKNGMNGTAEIITEDASLFTRIFRNIIKMLN